MTASASLQRCLVVKAWLEALGRSIMAQTPSVITFLYRKYFLHIRAVFTARFCRVVFLETNSLVQPTPIYMIVCVWVMGCYL